MCDPSDPVEQSEVDAGQVLIHQGDEGGGLFLIAAGHAQIRLGERNGAHGIVASLGPGDYFGEIALAADARHTANVVAVTPMTLWGLTRQDYTRFLSPLPEIDRQLAHTAASRASAVATLLADIQQAENGARVGAPASPAAAPLEHAPATGESCLVQDAMGWRSHSKQY
jgi:CRP-like cAMP-binding protein